MADRFPVAVLSVGRHGSVKSARRRFLKLLLSGTALPIARDLIAGDGKPALPNSPQETWPVVIHVDCKRLQQEIQGFGSPRHFITHII
jgi:hypothetical protein